MEIILFTLSLTAIVLDFTGALKNDSRQTVSSVHEIEALSGETIYLPCNVSTYDDDEVVLILWYRDGKSTPIYSVDIRGGYRKAAKRWSDDTMFGGRAYFILDKGPGALSIQDSKYSDSGIYRCRVDFLKAQTRNTKISLFIIGPADRILIRDDSNIERSTVVGPYTEGDVISLKCEVLGGKPLPQIHWYRDGNEINAKTNASPDEKDVWSVVILGPLGRDDLNSRIVCKALSHPRVPSIESVVQIDMNFTPLNIRLLGAHQPLSAGRRYDLLCQSAGSRPPAVITWWIDGIRLEKTTETTSSDGNQTTSTLSISFSKTDDGKLLTCKAYNHAIPSEPLEDGWKLDIQYIPEAYVRLGTSLISSAIREGTDVYFDCLVTAHPPVYKVEWQHNDKSLPRNVSQGVIVSNYSLVLQGVSKSTAGNYTCVGFNSEGEGTSAPFSLNILYAPTCLPNQPRIYGVAKQEDAKIRCSVDSNPPDVEFSWTFNNSAESIDVAANHISRAGTTSVVTYTPMTELDYGTLLCIATNKIGTQRTPCVFHIIAAGRPDQVHNCSLTNISMTSLTVTCIDGFNGGLPQLFILELIDSQTSEIRANITSTTPRFTVSTLLPGGTYTLLMYAFNSKGRSDPTVLTAAMLKMPEKQLTSEPDMGLFIFPAKNMQTDYLVSPMISLTVGLTLAVMVAGLAVVLALRIPCNNSRHWQKEFRNERANRNISPGQSDKSLESKEADDNEIDEKNPDVVPELDDPSDKNVSSYMYSHSIAHCTLPRLPNQQLLSNFGGSVPGAFPSLHQLALQAPVDIQPRMDAFTTSNNSPLHNSNVCDVNETPDIQYISQQPPQRNRKLLEIESNTVHILKPTGLLHKEIAFQTPFMIKRESNV
ncbi:sidestep VII transmembrane protein isoform 1-T3 [Glossina fuscipes fuscipes]